MNKTKSKEEMLLIRQTDTQMVIRANKRKFVFSMSIQII